MAPPRLPCTGDAVPVPRPPELPNMPPPPRLPWLIYPGTEPPTVYMMATRAYHNFHGLPADVRAARFCGSGDGGWMFLAFQPPHARGYALYNLHSHQRVPLPAVFRYPYDNTEYPLVVHAATFSRPTTTRAAPLMVAAIAAVEGRPTAAFWNAPLNAWSTMPGEALTELPQDVIYREAERAFWFLMPGEELVFYGPAPDPDGGGGLVLRRGDVPFMQRPEYPCPWGIHPADLSNIKRYLVQHNVDATGRNRLLMVLRFIYNPGVPTPTTPTDAFRVYELVQFTNEAGEMNAFWLGVKELGDLILCLGPGCSRIFAVEPDDDNGHLHNTMIYFLDERLFPLPAEVPAAAVDNNAGDHTDADQITGDDQDMEEEEVEDDVPDTGRYSYVHSVAYDWPLHPPRSDVPPTWWLHSHDA